MIIKDDKNFKLPITHNIISAPVCVIANSSIILKDDEEYCDETFHNKNNFENKNNFQNISENSQQNSIQNNCNNVNNLNSSNMSNLNSNGCNDQYMCNVSNEEEYKLILEQNNKYFLEYCKLYEANTILKNQLGSLVKEKNGIKNKMQKMEVQFIFGLFF
jgi:hypothetical protein